VRYFGIILLAALVIFSTHVNAEARDCTADEKATADRQLKLNSSDKAAAVEKHAPWGLASSTIEADREVILTQRDYLIDYDGDLLLPLWVAYRLDSKKLGKVDRVNCFRVDLRLKKESASAPSDYSEPIFDQGHMAPNGDMSLSMNSVVNSFIMSNMAPQYCQFNRGVWQILESLIRHWAEKRETLYVMSGSILDRNGDAARDADDDAKRMKSNNGKTRVAVPTSFYKVIIWEDEVQKLKSISFLLPHDQTDLNGDEALAYLEGHISKIAPIEKLAGLDILPNADTPSQATKLWDHEGFVSHSLVNDVCRQTEGMDH
jgi:endonuclease G